MGFGFGNQRRIVRRRVSSPRAAATRQQNRITLTNKEVICIPQNLASWDENKTTISNPRRRDVLLQRRLIAIIAINSAMTAQQLQTTIAEMFCAPFNVEVADFKFSYLQGGRRLSLPVTNRSMQWTPAAIRGLSRQGSLYILASHDLPQVGESAVTVHNVPLVIQSPAMSTSMASMRVSGAEGSQELLLSDAFCGSVSSVFAADETDLMADEVEDAIPNLQEINRGQLSAENLLQNLMAQVMTYGTLTKLRLRHSCAFSDFDRVLQRPSYSLKKHILVEFIGQPGIDSQGLTRELATLLISSLCSSHLLTGTPGRFTISANIAPLSSGAYNRIGRMVGFILCHAGINCNIFSRSMIHFLCGKEECMEEDIPDRELQLEIQQVNTAYPNHPSESLASKIGFQDLLTPLKKEKFLQAAIAHSITVVNRACIQQFITGLQELAVIDVVKDNLGAALELLCGEKLKELTPDELYDIFTIQYSEEGSTRRQREEAVSFEFLQFLSECGDNGCTLGDVLQFVSGVRIIPCGGFSGQPTLEFRESGYPTASTCAIRLELPIQLPLNKSFQEVMVEAIKGAQGILLE